MFSAMRTRLIPVGLFLLLCFGGITFLSQDFIYGQGRRQRPILVYVALFGSAFVAYTWILSDCLKNALPSTTSQIRSVTFKGIAPARSQLDFCLILMFALLCRVVLLFSNPIQEDDFYRYLWDGKVVASGLNPYGVPPVSIEEKRDGTRDYRAILESDNAFIEVLARVNHPWASTIYPPLAQGVFALAASIAPGSLFGLRIIFLLFDLGICLLLGSLLRHVHLPSALVLVYAWSPLVIKETINSTHYDVVPTFFLVFAIFALLQQWRKTAFTALALAILGKLYPLLLVPLFLWRVKKSAGWSWVCRGVAIMILILVAGYAPFLDAGAGLWQGAVIYAGQWQTNSLLFPFVAMLAANRWAANGVVGLLLAALCVTLAWRGNLIEDRAFLWSNFAILGALFLLSPVGDPWYFVWLMPFLCIFPLRSWILLSGCLGLYYVSFYLMYHDMKEAFRWIVWLEYLPFYGLFLCEWYNAWSKRESASSPKSDCCVPL